MTPVASEHFTRLVFNVPFRPPCKMKSSRTTNTRGRTDASAYTSSGPYKAAQPGSFPQVLWCRALKIHSTFCAFLFWNTLAPPTRIWPDSAETEANMAERKQKKNVKSLLERLYQGLFSHEKNKNLFFKSLNCYSNTAAQLWRGKVKMWLISSF